LKSYHIKASMGLVWYSTY